MEVLQEQEVTITETTQIMKRRRTKRQPRTGSVDDHLNIVGLWSPAISQESSGTSVTEEEKDMANCLILLAQGWPVTLIDARKPTRRCLYECKTCSRCFSSFQALGGHRAGHKKPKMILGAAAEKYENESLATPATRVHECLICGSEFSSGQALGGHMRRHRSALAGFSSSSSESKKEMGSLLGLDLNLPAPPEAVVGAEYAFAGERPMALKVATQQLVHCQY